MRQRRQVAFTTVPGDRHIPTRRGVLPSPSDCPQAPLLARSCVVMFHRDAMTAMAPRLGGISTTREASRPLLRHRPVLGAAVLVIPGDDDGLARHIVELVDGRSETRLLPDVLRSGLDHLASYTFAVVGDRRLAAGVDGRRPVDPCLRAASDRLRAAGVRTLLIVEPVKSITDSLVQLNPDAAIGGVADRAEVRAAVRLLDRGRYYRSAGLLPYLPPGVPIPVHDRFSIADMQLLRSVVVDGRSLHVSDIGTDLLDRMAELHPLSLASPRELGSRDVVAWCEEVRAKVHASHIKRRVLPRRSGSLRTF